MDAAIDRGDLANARAHAAGAAILLASIVPLLRPLKHTRKMPGVRRFGARLMAFAIGRTRADKFAREWKIQRHHVVPKYLSGEEIKIIVKLRAGAHQNLHTDLRRHLRRYRDSRGNTMDYKPGYSGRRIQRNFNKREILDGLADFYAGPGKKWANRKAVRAFFKNYPGLKR